MALSSWLSQRKAQAEAEQAQGPKRPNYATTPIGQRFAFTGYNKNSNGDKNNPVALFNTAGGPRMVHEGEGMVQNADGSTTVVPQSVLKHAQDTMKVPGYATGGVMPSSLLPTYSPIQVTPAINTAMSGINAVNNASSSDASVAAALNSSAAKSAPKMGTPAAATPAPAATDTWTPTIKPLAPIKVSAPTIQTEPLPAAPKINTPAPIATPAAPTIQAAPVDPMAAFGAAKAKMGDLGYTSYLDANPSAKATADYQAALASGNYQTPTATTAADITKAGVATPWYTPPAAPTTPAAPATPATPTATTPGGIAGQSGIVVPGTSSGTTANPAVVASSTNTNTATPAEQAQTLGLDVMSQTATGGSKAAKLAGQQAVNTAAGQATVANQVQAQQAAQTGLPADVAASRAAVIGAEGRANVANVQGQQAIAQNQAQETAAQNLVSSATGVASYDNTRAATINDQNWKTFDAAINSGDFTTASSVYQKMTGQTLSTTELQTIQDHNNKMMGITETQADITTQQMKNTLGDQQWASTVQQIGQGADLATVNSTLAAQGKPAITQAQYDSIRGNTAQQMQVDSQYGYNVDANGNHVAAGTPGAIHIMGTNEIQNYQASEQKYYDGAKKVTTDATTMLDYGYTAGKQDPLSNATIKADLMSTYQAQTGKTTDGTDSDFQTWAKQTWTAASDNRLINPIDAALYSIDSSTADDATKAVLKANIISPTVAAQYGYVWSATGGTDGKGGFVKSGSTNAQGAAVVEKPFDQYGGNYSDFLNYTSGGTGAKMSDALYNQVSAATSETTIVPDTTINTSTYQNQGGKTSVGFANALPDVGSALKVKGTTYLVKSSPQQDPNKVGHVLVQGQGVIGSLFGGGGTVAAPTEYISVMNPKDGSTYRIYADGTITPETAATTGNTSGVAGINILGKVS